LKILVICLLGSVFLGNASALAAAQDISKEASPLSERLPPKIQKIQKELPGWLETAETGDKEKAVALMQKLKEHSPPQQNLWVKSGSGRFPS
jgi:hypothetical protein